MKKSACCLVGAALVVLALSGCAAASAAGAEPAATSAAASAGDPGDVPALPVDPPSDIEIAAIPAMEFASAVGPVLESFPSDYAFFYFDSDMQPVVGFTDKAVPAVLDAVAATGQRAQIIEDAGFTDAEYTATADKLVAEVHATWPAGVLFPMIGPRPDLGIGAIGITRIAEEGSPDSTGLIQQIEVESPFTIQIDENVYGPGKTAALLP